MRIQHYGLLVMTLAAGCGGIMPGKKDGNCEQEKGFFAAASRPGDNRARPVDGVWLASGDTWSTGENPAAGGVPAGGSEEYSSDGDRGDSDDDECGGSQKAARADAKTGTVVSSGAEPPSSDSSLPPAAPVESADGSADDASLPPAGGEGVMTGAPTGGGNGDISWGILTAGTFDDALNSEHFASYWKQPLSADPWGGEDPSQLQWPDAASLPTGERFGGVAKKALDLSFVLDVTGSMGDELRYINAELDHIVGAVKEKFPEVSQRWSLIVYRDEGDEYVTRGINFTVDLAQFREFLLAQGAGGGGDTPEAMHTALQEAGQRLQWGDESTAKVMFLVADAPPHVQHVPATLDAIAKLQSSGVHIYPVASSGVDALAERVMRYAGLLTRGEYIFLTDDSGVGNPHAEPHVPCYYVRKLADVMIDTLIAEIQDARLTPDPATIIRTTGTPVNGKCEVQVQEGQQ